VTDQPFAEVVADDLRRIEVALQRTAVADSPYATQAARHVIDAGGKRFRPLLVVLAARLGDDAEQWRMDNAALVVELTHVASLYHDDVMDAAVTRRGVEAANLRYGNTVSILVGDYLFSRASSIVCTLGVEFVARQADTFAELVQGQIAETRGPDIGDDPMDYYLHVLQGKTASLIATSAVFGGMVAGLPADQIDTLSEYGHHLGMAFQLHDDLIDITSDSSGKTPGADLRAGVATLPVLLLTRTGSPADQALFDRIRAGLAPDEVGDVLATLRGHKVMELARKQVLERAERARAQLSGLPAGDARDALDALCDQVGSRAD
jgi:heptaprenyl diphosphate synthase